MRRLPLLAAACLIGRAALAEPPPTGPLPRDVRPTRYTLSLDVDPEQPRFSGEVAIAVHLDRARDTIWLHAKHLDVTQSTVAEGGAAPLPARLERATDDLVALRLPRPIG